MKYIKKKVILMTAFTIFLISSFMTITYAEKVISLEGNIETEGVDVLIESEGYNTPLAPGMTVPYEPVITYRGINAYLRVKFIISNENITLDRFSGLSDKWVKRGEYFYYTVPVEHNTCLSTFKSFHIPEQQSQLSEEMKVNPEFTITALCDAVQADNFTPDFECDNPWGEVIIENNDYDGTKHKCGKAIKKVPVYLKTKGSSAFSLDSEQLCNSHFRPGDFYENDIIINNDSRRKTELLFSSAELIEQSEPNLLDVVCLKMYIDGKEFYNGTLRAKKLNKWKSLVIMDKKSTHKIHYEIEMPAELGNCYELRFQNFVWNMTMREVSDGPVTGDKAGFLFWIIVMAVSVISILRINRKKIKKDED